MTTLSAESHVAGSQVDKARADLQSQRQQVNALTADLKRLDAQIANARADLAQAELNLTRCEIRAPLSGTIGQRNARSGQVVQAGAYLLSIVPDENIWVQANFKETQIGKMQPGQRAELLFDSYPTPRSKAASIACSPRPARSSACCRQIMPPATSPRWCSASR